MYDYRLVRLVLTFIQTIFQSKEITIGRREVLHKGPGERRYTPANYKRRIMYYKSSKTLTKSKEFWKFYRFLPLYTLLSRRIFQFFSIKTSWFDEIFNWSSLNPLKFFADIQVIIPVPLSQLTVLLSSQEELVKSTTTRAQEPFQCHMNLRITSRCIQCGTRRTLRLSLTVFRIQMLKIC